MTEFTRLALRILDEQLVDADGRRCGRVEDLELDGAAGQPDVHATAILCGATAWKRRLPPPMAELIPGDPRGLKRVSWEHVAKIANEIELDCAESTLQGAADAEAAPLSLSQLLGSPVLDHRGVTVGKVREVLAQRPPARVSRRPGGFTACWSAVARSCSARASRRCSPTRSPPAARRRT